MEHLVKEELNLPFINVLAKKWDDINSYGLNDLLKILTDNNVEISYLYVFIGKNNLGAEAILKTPDIEAVEALLLNNYY